MLLPAEEIECADLVEQLVLSLSLARKLAADSIRAAQCKYKDQYDKRARAVTFKVGDWVLVRFPQEESGKQRKLSRPWHGPYRVVERSDPVVKVYFPQEGTIHIH